MADTIEQLDTISDTWQRRNDPQKAGKTKTGEIYLHKVAGRQNITYMYSRLACRRPVSSYSSVALLSIVEVASYSYDGYNTHMAAILLHTGSIQTV